MECVICEQKFEKNILFENDKIIIMLAIEPSVNGHIQIFSKPHYTIMEQVPDEIIEAMTAAANKMSIILFEALKVHGTNIIINNGIPAGQKVPHFSIDILPRRTDDDLKLDWTLKQAAPEALDSIHRIIEESVQIPDTKQDKFSEQDESSKEPESYKAQNRKKDEHDDEDDDDSDDEHLMNYYHQFLERIP